MTAFEDIVSQLQEASSQKEEALVAAKQDQGFEKVLQANHTGISYKVTSNSTAPLDDSKLRDPSQCIAELNRRYGVAKVKGKVFVLDTMSKPIDLLSKQAFLDLFANRKVSKGQESIPLGPYWFTHEQRRQYLNGIVFDPSGQQTSDVYNLWRGWSVHPDSSESCDLFLWHLRHIICGDDEKCFEYLLDWLAQMVQEPWIPPGVAVCLLSDQGTGKGVFMNYIGKIPGQHYKPIIDKQQLLGQFTGQLEDAILVFADELYWDGKKGDTGILKGLITEKTRMMEKKYMEPFPVMNCVHLVIASNEKWAIPAEMGDRRFFVLKVSEEKKGDSAYFKALAHEMESGGPQALLHLLLNRDISSFTPGQFPKTAARVDQQLQSMEPIDRWMHQILTLGTNPLATTESPQPWPTRLIKAYLYESYCAWFRRSCRYGRPENLSLFTQALKNYGIRPVKMPAGTSGYRAPGYLMPDLSTIRKTFEAMLGHPVEWDDT